MTTITELIPEFEEHIRDERQLATNTIVSYRQDLVQWDELLGCDFEEINIDGLRAVIRLHKVNGLTGATIRRKLHALSTFYKFQMLQERATNNPALLVQQLAPRRKRKVQQKILTVSQWRAFLHTPDPMLRNSVAWGLLAWLGIRNFEVRALQIHDIDLEAGHIVIRGKGGHERRLPLPAPLHKPIEQQIAGRDPNEYLLLGDMGGFWSRQSFTNQFNAHIAAAGLPEDVTPHWLRHTVATYLSEQLDVFKLKDWMGHKSTRTTELYVHNSQDVLTRVMDKHPLLKE